MIISKFKNYLLTLFIMLLIFGAFIAGRKTAPSVITKADVKNHTAKEESPIHIFKLYPVYEYEYQFTTMEEQKKNYSSYRNWRLGPERLDQRLIEELIKIPIKKGDVVADIGCGFGYYTFPLSQAVGKDGKVYATDIRLEPLKILMTIRKKSAMQLKEKDGLYFENIIPLLNDVNDLTLPPNFLDVALLIEVHILHYIPDGSKPRSQIDGLTQEQICELNYKKNRQFLESIYKSIKPGGKFVVIEDYGKEVVLEKKYIIKQVEKCNFRFSRDVEVEKNLRCQFLIFEK